MEIKTGAKTSEFYLALVPQVIGVLALIGIIPNEQVDEVVRLVVAAVTGLMSIIALVAYIISRIQVKKEALKAEAKVEVAKIENKK